jgi:acetyl-CoA acetyltransferase
MAHELRGAAAVAGIGLTEFSELPGRNHLEVLAEAAHYALEDAGLSMPDVDGLFVSSMGRVFHPLHAAEYLGIQPSVIDGTNIGGSSFVNCVQSAAMAIRTGVCKVALIAYGSTNRSNRKNKSARAAIPTPAPGMRPNTIRAIRSFPMPLRRRGTCMNMAPSASIWPRSRFRRGGGRCGTRAPKCAIP